MLRALIPAVVSTAIGSAGESVRRALRGRAPSGRFWPPSPFCNRPCPSRGLVPFSRRWRLPARQRRPRRNIGTVPRDRFPPFLRSNSMKSMANVGLKDVQAVYSGPEGELWELVMGSRSTSAVCNRRWSWPRRPASAPAAAASICAAATGPACGSCVRFRDVARMQGVDATEPWSARTMTAAKRKGWPADHLRARRRHRDRPARRQRPTSSGARTPGATWSTRTRLIGRGRPAAEARRHHRLHRLDRGPAPG